MRERRQRLKETLEEAQVALLRMQINAAEMVDRAEAMIGGRPAGPPELIDEVTAARAAIAATHQIERYWKRVGERASTPPWP